MLESMPMARRFYLAGFYFAGFFYPCPLAEDNG
jgi:hypothetical protein